MSLTNDQLLANNRNQAFGDNVANQPVIVKSADRFLDGPDVDRILPAYPMRSRNRGQYLIINNKSEHLAQSPETIDLKNLLSLFHQMGLVGEAYTNVTLDEAQRKIQRFTKTRLLPKPDCCIVVIMGNGRHENETFALCHDNKLLSLEWVKQCFNSKNSEDFQGIPKIFIFDVPRGEIYQTSVTPGRMSEESVSACMCPVLENIATDTAFLPEYSDMLVCWATYLGFSNIQESTGRSWFIDSICKIWSEYACTCHVEDLMKLVQEDLRHPARDGQIQTPIIENLNFRICYLHPGLF